jgi:transcriptional regulator
MYVPKYFQQHDAEEIVNFIRHNSFGVLVSQKESKLTATHIPLELSEDKTKLRGHMAKANPQWQNFSDGKEVLAIFNGPHTYVSSSWYDHENVPTWNYIAVHVYGTISIMEGDALRLALKELVDKYESKVENPISMEKMSPAYVDRAIKGLVGFEISITNIEASYKLSQNRDDKNHAAIVSQLEKRSDYDSKEVAEAMRKTRSKTINQPS